MQICYRKVKNYARIEIWYGKLSFVELDLNLRICKGFKIRFVGPYGPSLCSILILLNTLTQPGRYKRSLIVDGLYFQAFTVVRTSSIPRVTLNIVL